MGTTPKLGLRYPSASDAPDGPGGIYNLATDVENLTQDEFVDFAGTMHDFNQAFRTLVRRSGKLATLVINVNPGANGASASSTNNLLFVLPGTCAPLYALDAVVPVFMPNGVGWTSGDRAVLEIGLDNSVKCNYMSPGTLYNGGFISGAVTYPIA